MKLIMTLGLPASGKSTWAKEQVVKSGGNVKRVNKDDLRSMVDGGKWSKDNEKNILLIRDQIIKHYLATGASVIVDDTNLHPKHATALKTMASEHSATFETKSFLDVPIAECIKRDLARANSVGERVIRDMHAQFLQGEPLVYHPPEDMPLAIICDIDGTLAHHVNRSPYDWLRVGEDILDDDVASILHKFDATHNIILVSGRDSICRTQTEKWLKDFGIKYSHLYMRPEGDNRKDSIVKRELFDQHIRQNYQVQFVLDDREQTVQMWRNMGLKCLQVAEGRF